MAGLARYVTRPAAGARGKKQQPVGPNGQPPGIPDGQPTDPRVVKERITILDRQPQLTDGDRFASDLQLTVRETVSRRGDSPLSHETVAAMPMSDPALTFRNLLHFEAVRQEMRHASHERIGKTANLIRCRAGVRTDWVLEPMGAWTRQARPGANS